LSWNNQPRWPDCSSRGFSHKVCPERCFRRLSAALEQFAKCSKSLKTEELRKYYMPLEHIVGTKKVLANQQILYDRLRRIEKQVEENEYSITKYHDLVETLIAELAIEQRKNTQQLMERLDKLALEIENRHTLLAVQLENRQAPAVKGPFEELPEYQRRVLMELSIVGESTAEDLGSRLGVSRSRACSLLAEIPQQFIFKNKRGRKVFYTLAPLNSSGKPDSSGIAQIQSETTQTQPGTVQAQAPAPAQGSGPLAQ
jgi:hypothetical protein